MISESNCNEKWSFLALSQLMRIIHYLRKECYIVYDRHTMGKKGKFNCYKFVALG